MIIRFNRNVGKFLYISFYFIYFFIKKISRIILNVIDVQLEKYTKKNETKIIIVVAICCSRCK